MGSRRWVGILLGVGLAWAQGSADEQQTRIAGLYERGEYREAETSARQRLAVLQELGEAESLDAAGTLDQLARAQVALATEISQADEELQRAIAIKSRMLGPESSALAVSLNILAAVKTLRSDYPGALATLERARALQEKDPATPAKEVADVLYSLGQSMQDSGRYTEARQFHLRALEIREREFGPGSAPAAEVRANLGTDCWLSGDMEHAKEYLERALHDLEQTVGPDHPLTAAAAGQLGATLKLSGHFAEASKLYARAVAIYEKRLGPEHPRLAAQLNNLGLALKELDDYPGAGEMMERALRIFEKVLGPEHSRTATVLANLGIIYQQSGDFPRARQAYERALAIQEKRLGPEHPLVGSALTSLGLLVKELGDYAESKKYLARALAIYQKKTAPDNPKTLDVMVNLGEVSKQMGDRVRARDLFQRAIDLRTQSLGPDSPDLAGALMDLGEVLFECGDFAGARASYQEALRVQAKNFGSNHHHTSEALGHLGFLTAAEGDYAAAAQYLRDAIDSWGKTMSPDHNRQTGRLAELARAEGHLGHRGEAMSAALEADRIWRAHVRLTLLSTPERQALIFVALGNDGLGQALSLAAQGPLAEADRRAVWDALIRDRALALDEVAERHRIAYASGDPEATALEQRLSTARAHLSRLAMRSPAGSANENAARVQQARMEVESAEEALAGKVLAARRELTARRHGYAEVAAALPAGSALVAYVRYDREQYAKSRAPVVASYLAFVVKSGEQAPTLVALGSADAIESAVAGWRREIQRESASMGRNATFNEQSYRTAGTALRRAIWDPLAAHLRGAKSVYVVPDGALQLVNLNTLPAGTNTYLAEGGTLLHTLSAERDLADAHVVSHASGLLAIGNPAYQAAPVHEPMLISRVYRGSHSRCSDFASLRFQPLPASAQEVRTILSIWPSKTEGAQVLTGAQATEAAFKEDAPGKRVVHLATHGFFLEEGCHSDAALRENPLLRAGLVLAGANQRQMAGPDEEDGILTAEEVASLNLEGTEWVVLSGCDTGYGEVRGNEGVLGLRRAFRIAGVSTLIASLWPVEDEAARQWMSSLYRYRFQKHGSTSESVSHAMRSQIEERRAKGLSTHPFYWGSFIAVGDWR